MEGGRVHCIQCISVTIGESLQQKMLKNHWKMKVSVNMGGAVATGNAQKPMEKHDFSQGGVTQPPPPTLERARKSC